MDRFRLDLTTALQEESRSQSGGRLIGRTRRALVAAQIALAFVLLTSAGLLMRSFFAVLNRQSELRTEHVLTFGIALPEREYSKIADAQVFDRELNRRLSALPGAMSVGFGTDLPLEARWQRLISPDHLVNRAKPVVDYSDIEGAYFRSLGLRLIAGKFFDNHGRKDSELVAIVNESFGRTFWPGEAPLGHQFKIGSPQSKLPWVRIVGSSRTRARVIRTRGSDRTSTARWISEPFPVVGRDVWFVLRTQRHALDLGALRSQVFGPVLWEGVQLALLGLAVGLPASFAVAHLIGGLLYGVTTNDALTVAGVITAHRHRYGFRNAAPILASHARQPAGSVARGVARAQRSLARRSRGVAGVWFFHRSHEA